MFGEVIGGKLIALLCKPTTRVLCEERDSVNVKITKQLYSEHQNLLNHSTHDRKRQYTAGYTPSRSSRNQAGGNRR